MAAEVGGLHREATFAAAELHAPARSVALARRKTLHQRHTAVQVGALLKTLHRYSVARQEGANLAAHERVLRPVRLLTQCSKRVPTIYAQVKFYTKKRRLLDINAHSLNAQL